MDNLCHTLAGAALGEAGLKRRTGLGMATLMIGANFPDIDAVAAFTPYGLAFRRGWTHGIPALVVLPFLLTGLILLYDRTVRRRAGRVPESPVIASQVLLLAFVAIWSHPLLDYMNDYGMRWLMPFSGRWFYGDALFIIDPWMWGALGLGVFGARRLGARGWRLAVAAIGVVTVYASAMYASAAHARAYVDRMLAVHAAPPEAVMVGPVPVNPFRRRLVIQEADRYLFGSVSWAPGMRVEIAGEPVPRNDDHPRAREAAATETGRRFLVWSRFPFYVIEETPTGARVRIDDARYASPFSPSWAAVEVHLPTRATPLAAANPDGTRAEGVDGTIPP